jgi:hypothetical protein
VPIGFYVGVRQLSDLVDNVVFVVLAQQIEKPG